MFAGSIGSMTVLGAPDLIVLTLTEFAAQAYRINRAGNLPLLVDADHGYGNALNVKRTVEELETAGVARAQHRGHDAAAPFGAAASRRLIPIAEGVGKMKAALAGRQDPTLVIAGRTSADRDHRPRRLPSPAARPTRRPASMRCSSSASHARPSSMRSPRRPSCR